MQAIQTGNLRRIIIQKAFGLREHKAVTLVKTASDLAGLLDMGQLVLAAGHDIALAEQDVTCLMHGIRQKKAGKSMARCFLLGLNRGVAKELCLGYQRKEREHELI